MPKAEVGSTKWLGNKMKAKGLQRLRWYCQVCERQMRDANGFKQHTLSEGHVRQMQVVGQNANKYINDYSNQFKNDFVQLLRRSHGEKKININHFYQEYIANKEHVHMNATKWPSLTEFAKDLGREGICRVEEGERGLEVAWVDNSPEALRRQDAIRKKERQDKGDEEREQKLIDEQIRRAKRDAEERPDQEKTREEVVQAKELQRQDGEKLVLSFGTNKAAEVAKSAEERLTIEAENVYDSVEENPNSSSNAPVTSPEAIIIPGKQSADTDRGEKLKLDLGASKPKNVFAASTKKNSLAGAKLMFKPAQAKPMSEAERIMRGELERKRYREEMGSHGLSGKRMRM